MILLLMFSIILGFIIYHNVIKMETIPNLTYEKISPVALLHTLKTKQGDLL